MSWFKAMNRTRRWFLLFLGVALLACSCAPLSEQGPQGEFLKVCKAKAQAAGGKITKQEFVAEAMDKAQAEQIFDACDVNRRGYLTEEEMWDPQRQRMMQSVIRLTGPR
jgi:hypothetical protein